MSSTTPLTAPVPSAMHAAPTPAPPRAMPPPPLSELPTIPVARERTPTPLPRRQPTEATPDRSRRPVAAATRRPGVQSKKQSQAYSFALIAAAVAVVAVLGAAADWMFVHQDADVSRGAQASMPAISEKPAAPAPSEPPADAVPAVDDRPASKDLAAEAPAAAPVRTPAPAPAAKDAASSKPKPVAPAKPAKAVAAPAAKPARPQNASRETAPASAPALTASAATAPASAPPVREAAPAPVPEKAAAVGPFFETKDVSETPRITARVEPRLPADLKARKVHEIIIVRALVSQNGHPSRVSVLRKSKTGPQLDDVVVAAVNQWTFTPAKKKGEAVSCWFNFGVTVGAGD
jgi:periplasmic protein TonB